MLNRLRARVASVVDRVRPRERPPGVRRGAKTSGIRAAASPSAGRQSGT